MLVYYEQLMAWFNAGTDEIVTAPDLLGCVQLPLPSMCFGESECVYTDAQRSTLLQHLRDERAHILPWPQTIQKCFSKLRIAAAAPSGQSSSLVLLGSPMLDSALGLVGATKSAMRCLTNTHTAAANGRMFLHRRGEVEEQFDNILAPESNTEWVQCEKCCKWRRVAWFVDTHTLSEQWECSLNTWDIDSANCSVPQDNFDPTSESTVQFSENTIHDDGTGEGGHLALGEVTIGKSFDVFCEKNQVYYEATVVAMKAPGTRAAPRNKRKRNNNSNYDGTHSSKHRSSKHKADDPEEEEEVVGGQESADTEEGAEAPENDVATDAMCTAEPQAAAVPSAPAVPRLLKFHFKGWKSSFDEWISEDSDRICPIHTHTHPEVRNARDQERWQGLDLEGNYHGSSANSSNKKGKTSGDASKTSSKIDEDEDGGSKATKSGKENVCNGTDNIGNNASVASKQGSNKGPSASKTPKAKSVPKPKVKAAATDANANANAKRASSKAKTSKDGASSSSKKRPLNTAGEDVGNITFSDIDSDRDLFDDSECDVSIPMLADDISSASLIGTSNPLDADDDFEMVIFASPKASTGVGHSVNNILNILNSSSSKSGWADAVESASSSSSNYNSNVPPEFMAVGESMENPDLVIGTNMPDSAAGMEGRRLNHSGSNYNLRKPKSTGKKQRGSVGGGRQSTSATTPTANLLEVEGARLRQGTVDSGEHAQTPFGADGGNIGSGGMDLQVRGTNIGVHNNSAGNNPAFGGVAYLDDQDAYTVPQQQSLPMPTFPFETPNPITLEEHSGIITKLRCPTNTSLLVSSSQDGTIRLWNGTGTDTSSKLIVDANNFSAGAIKPNDAVAVVAPTSPGAIRVLTIWAEDHCSALWAACSDGGLRVWNGADGKPLRYVKAHEDTITAIEGCQDYNINPVTGNSSSNLVGTGSADKSVRVWDMRAKRPQVFLFRGHSDGVVALRWGEAGRSVLSASKDKTVRIWDTRAGRLRVTLERHFSAVNALRAVPNAGPGGMSFQRLCLFVRPATHFIVC
jgi:WD40 repeat protein